MNIYIQHKSLNNSSTVGSGYFADVLNGNNKNTHFFESITGPVIDNYSLSHSYMDEVSS